MALVDAMGHLVNFEPRPGNAAEYMALPALVSGVATEELIADQDYDTAQARNWLI